MRLKDIENLHQIECAKLMNISRQTFQLIIDSARKKVVTALIEGKSIHISGGNYITNSCNYVCHNCKSKFDLVYELDALKCPICGSENLECTSSDKSCKNACNQSIDSNT